MHGEWDPALVHQLPPHHSCSSQSEMKATVKGTHMCGIQDAIQEPAPPCTQRFQSRTELQFQGEDEQ